MVVNDEIVDAKIAAVVNEYEDIKRVITDKVKLERLTAKPGEMARWRFTVNVETYYRSSPDDMDPKQTDKIVFYMIVPNTYPEDGPKVIYPSDCILASVNVYKSGIQCIDKWIYDPKHTGNNSTLLGAVEKTLKDIIHDPSVTRFDSMACGKLEDWQKRMYKSKALPTCPTSTVLKSDEVIRAGEHRPVRVVKAPSAPVVDPARRPIRVVRTVVPDNRV